MLYFPHMERTLKTLLLWLLMALVPLHAGAAAMGISCGPAHQQTMSAAADHHEHEADNKDVDVTAVSAESHPSSDAAKALDGPAHSSCSACSDFCIGAVAPPSSFGPFPTFSGAEAVVVSPSPSVAGFVPDGLKRPPRNISA